MYQFRNLLIIIFYFIACSGETRKYEYIEKNDTFRNKIDSGYFSLLTHGYTYYEFDNLNNEEIIVLVHGFSVPSYIWDETYYESIKRGYGVLRMIYLEEVIQIIQMLYIMIICMLTRY